MASVNVPRDIQDSIREALGKRVKLFIKRMVKQEVKLEKWEQRVLVFSGCRLFVFIPKTPARLENNFNYLDIQAIESKKQNQLSVTVDSKTYNFVTLEAETEEVNHMITHLAVSLRHIFPDFTIERLIKKIEVCPPERTKMMTDMTKNISKETGPCGGFTMMYACMCDYHSLPFRAEVEWDIDTIYLSQDSRELRLRDFDHLEARDLVPIIGALEHNTWFTKLDANDVKLTLEAQQSEVFKVMRRNAVINELCLSNSGISSDFVQKLSVALLSNSSTTLHSIDLSKNAIDDKAITHLIGSLGSLCRGLIRFDISHAKITGRGLNKVAETLTHNTVVGGKLQKLNMADNQAKGEDLQKLYHFLASPNTLTRLDLSGIDCALENLFGPLLRGCCATLTHLSLARNSFTSKKVKEVSPPPSWKQFFASVYDLQHLNLSGCKLPNEPLRELLLGIGSNINLSAVHLDLSSNELMSQGASVLESCIGNIACLKSLDLSNNGLDQSLISLLNWIGNNRALKHLAIGRNFDHIRPRNLPGVLDAIVQLIQDEDSHLASLSLADSKLKGSIATILNSLGSNLTLVEIDISGNNMGDFGARMLSKALQINTKLRTIMWDKNATTVQGFEDIAGALEKNYTLKKMPTPINDAGPALKQHPERTESALQKIEMLLQRNHSPQKYSSDQGFRMQQGFLVSSTQQMMDRLVVQNQDTVNALDRGNTEDFQSDMDMANSLIKDAGNSKQLLPQLQVIANKSLSTGNPVEACLKEMSDTLRQVLEKHMKKTVEDMFECTSNQCASVMANKELLSDLETNCAERSSLPKDFTKHILDSVETEIFNKLSELNLVVATHVSDKVMDEVIDSLSSSHKTLTNHLNVMKSSTSMKSQRESKKEDLEGKDVEEKLDEGKEKPDTGSQEKISLKVDSSPMLTFWCDGTENTWPVSNRLEVVTKDSPVIDRRKSKYSRMTRPPTVIDAEQVQKALQLHNRKLEATAELSPPKGDPVDPIQTTPKVTPVTTPQTTPTMAGPSPDSTPTSHEPVPKPRIKRRSVLVSVSEKSESQGQGVAKQPNESQGVTKQLASPTITVGSTEDLTNSVLSRSDTIPEEPSSSLTSSVTSETIDLGNLGESGPKLFNPNKGRAKRQKNHQSRRPGVAPNVATNEPLQADEGLDTFFNRQTVKEHTVMAPVVEVTRSQSSKSVSAVKVKKEKSQKEKEKEPKKSGFAGLFGRKKKTSTDESAKSDKSPDRSKTKGSSPDRSSASSKVGGLFERNSKVRLSPFKNKKDKKADKSPDRNDKAVKEEESKVEKPAETEQKPAETVKEVSREPTPEPQVVREPSPEPQVEPKVEPEPEEPKQPKQALKPKFGLGGGKPMGFGGDMLQQMRQNKRFSSNNLLDGEDSPTATSPVGGPTASLPSPQTNGSPKVSMIASKPRPAPRNRRSEAEETIGTAGSGDRKSLDGKKPPPPLLKPRPPKPPNKPGSSPRSSSNQSSVSDDSLDGENKSTDGKKVEEGVVVDSKTLRMSMEDKIKKMGLDTGVPTQEIKRKSSSLPRDQSLPNMSKEKEKSLEWKHRSVHDPMNVSTTSEELSPISVSSEKNSDSSEKLSVNGDKDKDNKKDIEQEDDNGNKGESSPPDTDANKESADDVIMV
ncbi:F-actin-uncapping protein LRRC16A-like isoform X3 [Mizuhopecten yessoensis]|uniref:F-actin-uncapping protein LRRC16A-like isoform X3 n=1 Tax=Mizuhopecten yessoensis TaxID=6573 RepID=UPI000B45B2C9|nr:F-actin-uncapping protein LRRC16A-like isoform X3 [Mizuhopecten yessoensis]